MIIYKNENIQGLKINKLTLLEEVDVKKQERRGVFLCECGRKKEIVISRVMRGDTKSCGCIQKESVSKIMTTHGKTKSRLYKIWTSMLNRCRCENSVQFKNYGGRGIKVCEEWKSSFSEFEKWSLENGYDENLSIDRINVNGNYEPSNCKWSTREEQMKNKTNTWYEYYNGEKMRVKEICEILNLYYVTVKSRKKYGKKGEELFKPTNKGFSDD